MCGIAGHAGTVAEGSLERAVGALKHRGPDGDGVLRFPDAARPVGLGHTRLAVIDLSAAGRQPLGDERRGWITYNGEIYNTDELRTELLAEGEEFRSRTDTEVVLAAYHHWGRDCLARLNGIFAFAIYEPRHDRLFLARDRLGVKPLYYSCENGRFAFGSELKALLEMGCAAEPDWEAIHDYFSFLYVPGDRTAFRSARQLLPGHWLSYDVRDGRLESGRYWSPIGNGKRRPATGNLAEASRELRELVADAVRRQLVSDVPLGLFLSGGIDSTILTALAAEASGGPIDTFTVTFRGPGISAVDDREDARRVSERFGTAHHEVEVDLSDPRPMLDLVSCFDQPFGNPTFYLSYLISRETRKGVTVALSGAGGDELFAGYPRYRALRAAGLLSAMPESLGRLARLAASLVPESPDRPWIRRGKLLLRGIGVELPEQYLRWAYYFSDEEKERLVSPAIRRLVNGRRSSQVLEEFFRGERDAGLQAGRADLLTFLPDNILEYTDKTSMAVGLEVRVPILDHRVVEWSLGLPFEWKLRRGVSKLVLREAFRDLIPRENLRAPKRGFCPPLATWMSQSLDAYFDHCLDAAYVRREGIFSFEEIQRLRAEHKRGRRDNSMELFGIIMFDVWWRKYVIHRPAEAWSPS